MLLVFSPVTRVESPSDRQAAGWVDHRQPLGGRLDALVIVSRVLSWVFLRVDLREQLLHLLGRGVELPCAGAVREGVDEFLGADGDEVM